MMDTPMKAVALVLLGTLSVGCEGGLDGAAPLDPPAQAAAACASPTPAPDPSPPPPARTGIWMKDGFIRDAIEAGLGAIPGGLSTSGGAITAYTGYGWEGLTIRRPISLAGSFDLIPAGVADSVVFGDRRESSEPPEGDPRFPYWLARSVFSGMTKFTETTKDGMTIRESPGGRIHCELSSDGTRANCALREVLKVDDL
jgi:hypothetical protein